MLNDVVWKTELVLKKYYCAQTNQIENWFYLENRTTTFMLIYYFTLNNPFYIHSV